MRVGMLTGGGDCPGLNAVIRAAVRKGILHHKDEFVGFTEGVAGCAGRRDHAAQPRDHVRDSPPGWDHSAVIADQREEDRWRP